MTERRGGEKEETETTSVGRFLRSSLKSNSIGRPSPHTFFSALLRCPPRYQHVRLSLYCKRCFPLPFPIATVSVGTAVKEKEVDALGRTDLSIWSTLSFLLPARALALSWGPVRRGHGCFAWGPAGRLGSSHGPSRGRWSIVRLLFLFLPRVSR